MRLATLIGIGITSFYYIAIGCIGYAGFGNDVPANLLTGFGCVPHLDSCYSCSVFAGLGLRLLATEASNLARTTSGPRQES